ncbi:hypothetical protein GGX14DRAFT_673121 [Mycena pura]|uniref:Uncharacterized protein n=1 Tax=Mycena pura TaxID=153505 RepID=A0AAD6UWU2_9AGAR|nr:hypothetical protein GGX14DRAFT_673121 [Mycena pura]
MPEGPLSDVDAITSRPPAAALPAPHYSDVHRLLIPPRPCLLSATLLWAYNAAAFALTCHVHNWLTMLLIMPQLRKSRLMATSRAIIMDIRALVWQLNTIDVPRPVALVCTLLCLQLLRTGFLAHGLRRAQHPAVLPGALLALCMWTEISNICRSQSFRSAAMVTTACSRRPTRWSADVAVTAALPAYPSHEDSGGERSNGKFGTRYGTSGDWLPSVHAAR